MGEACLLRWNATTANRSVEQTSQALFDGLWELQGLNDHFITSMGPNGVQRVMGQPHQATARKWKATKREATLIGSGLGALQLPSRFQNSVFHHSPTMYLHKANGHAVSQGAQSLTACIHRLLHCAGESKDLLGGSVRYSTFMFAWKAEWPLCRWSSLRPFFYARSGARIFRCIMDDCEMAYHVDYCYKHFGQRHRHDLHYLHFTQEDYI